MKNEKRRLTQFEDIATGEEKNSIWKGRPIHFTNEKNPIYLSQKTLHEIQTILFNTSQIKSFEETGYANVRGIGDVI